MNKLILENGIINIEDLYILDHSGELEDNNIIKFDDNIN